MNRSVNQRRRDAERTRWVAPEPRPLVMDAQGRHIWSACPCQRCYEHRLEKYDGPDIEDDSESED